MDKVNIDVTTAITLVTDITNDTTLANRFGDVNVWKKFNMSIYNQILDDIDCPVLSQINELICKKKWVMVKPAYEKFVELIETNGSDGEKQRMNELKLKITVIDSNPSKRFSKLKKTKLWSEINIDVFGTADKYGMYTVTGNIKLAKYMHDYIHNVNFVYHAHRPRCFVGIKYPCTDNSNSNSESKLDQE